MLSEIRDRLPYEHTIYFGDTARVPYGVRDLDEVRGFAFEIIRYLISLNVKIVVVACNTATAAALEAAQAEFDVPVVGVIAPGARAAVLETLTRRVGVLATESTVRSGAYRLRRERSASRETSRVCWRLAKRRHLNIHGKTNAELPVAA